MLLTVVRNGRGRYFVNVKHTNSQDREQYLVAVRKFLPAEFTFHTKIVPHICVRRAVEVNLSDCPAGCKVYRCKQCGTKATVHNKIYGCRHPKAH